MDLKEAIEKDKRVFLKFWRDGGENGACEHVRIRTFYEVLKEKLGRNIYWERTNNCYKSILSRLDKLEQKLEPECDHGVKTVGNDLGFRLYNEKHCRDCGEKL